MPKLKLLKKNMEKLKRRNGSKWCITKLWLLTTALSASFTVLCLWTFTSRGQALFPDDSEDYSMGTVIDLGEISASALRIPPIYSEVSSGRLLPLLSSLEPEEEDTRSAFDVSATNSEFDQVLANVLSKEEKGLEVMPYPKSDESNLGSILLDEMETTTPPVLNPFETEDVFRERAQPYIQRLLTIQQQCNNPTVLGQTASIKHVMKFLNAKTNNWVSFSAPLLGGLRDDQTVEEQQQLQKINVQWCPVFKAASSPWMAVFMRLKHRLTARTEQTIAKGQSNFIKLAKMFHMSLDEATVDNAKFPNLTDFQSFDRNENSEDVNVRLLIARHPFERLVSAYRDKLERISGRHYYHTKYGLPIVRQFRFHNDWMRHFDTPLMRERQRSNNTSNAELNGVVEDDSDSEERSNATSHKRPEALIPTFNEFVQYLLTSAPANWDEHWRPIYADCDPCAHKFNLVFKVETMDRDRDFFLNDLMGMNESALRFRGLQRVWRRWSNSVSDTYDHKKHERYFSKVSKKDLRALYKKYEVDFKLFGYEDSLEDYISMGS